MRALHKLAFVLVIIGALNWGLVALGTYAGGDWNVVKLALGQWPQIESLVYLLVGLSALVLVFTHGRDCRNCKP